MAESRTAANRSEAPSSPQDPLAGFSADQLRDFLREMLLYRRFEEKAEEAYAIGKIGGFCHLHIGQEGVALGCIGVLRSDDYVISAYRTHTQALAKGVDPDRVMAELYGKSSGVSAGRGGSMHLFDAELCFMGGHGIVGGQIPLGAGIAWAIRYRGEDRVCVCFLGDAAVNQGAFHETLNMAAVWRLPIIFVVENNEYGMGTAFRRVSATEIVDRACAYGIGAEQIQGQHVLETYRTMQRLVEEVRDGGGPRLLEVRTYRFKGHSMSDPVSGTYRSKEEVSRRMEEGDPIVILRDHLFAAGILTRDELEDLDAEVRARVQQAADAAEAAPDPGAAGLYDFVYSDMGENGRLFLDGRDR